MPTCSLSSYLVASAKSAWRHIISANCDFEGESGPIVPMFTGLSGNTWETAKIAHRVMTSGVSAGAIFVLLAELGLRKPPSGCISRDIHGGQLINYSIN